MGRMTSRRVVLITLIAVWLLVGTASTRADTTRRRIHLPVLMYHYISAPPADADVYRLDLSVTPDQFAAHLGWLRDNGFTTVTLDDLYLALTEGKPLPPRPVIITFDDGYADAYNNAFRLLRSYGMVGTFFVVTEWVDSADPRYISWDEARDMAAAGMSIESHSRTHPDLTGCDYDCLVYQILGSVQTIEAQIGTRPRFFCYPSGRYNDSVMAVLSQVGIVAAVTTEAGTIHTSDRLLELKRARVRNTTTVDDLAWMLLAWDQ